MDIIKRTVNYLLELNNAKRTPRNGWHRLGIRPAESICEHMAATAQIAYVLAQMEGADADHAAILALFHDVGEIRTGDEDWISRIYKNKKDSESAAFKAQVEGLPMEAAICRIYDEFKERKTKEAVIAKDADLLELALQAKVYEESGFRGALTCVDGVRGEVKTGSAKKLLSVLEKSRVMDWWTRIPEISLIIKKSGRKKQ